MRPLLLDLDGTLIDSRADLAAAVNLLLIEHGLHPLSEELVTGFVGNGARSLVRRALDAADPARAVPRDDLVLRGFLAHYTTVLLRTTAPFPGVSAGLARLRAAGVPVAIVTNKPLAPTLAILEGLGLREHVQAIVAGDSLPLKKPDPAPLRHAAKLLGVDLATARMVGDSDVDAEAAHAAGIEFIWCSFGRIHPDRPQGPCAVAESFRDVVELALRP